MDQYSNKIKYKHIIFDFDGTLADSFYLAREYFDMAAKDSGVSGLTKEQIEKIREKRLTFKNVWNFIKDKDIALINYPRLFKNLLEELLFNKDRLRLFKEVPQLLTELKEQGAKLYIVTYNQQNIVENTLKKYGCYEYFKAINAMELFKNKAEILLELFKRFSLEKKEVIYIGDEIKDIETAHEIGIKAIIVEWQFNTPRVLAKKEPEYQVKNFKQLKECLIPA